VESTNLCYAYALVRLSGGCGGVTGAVPPISGEQGFLADLNETRRIFPGMPILLNQIR
jgi:hypothetical protein